jgi:long-chain acyl-CoA synthetase
VAEPRTTADLFSLWRSTSPEPALVDARNGATRRIAAAQVVRAVAGLARGFASLGVVKGDRVALLCGNRPEWHMLDFALHHLGALDVPIYATLLPPQVRQILADSQARAVVVENHEQLAKVVEVQASCPDLRDVIVIDGDPPDGVRTMASLTEPIESPEAEAYLEAQRATLEPTDLATLIYTSGTTGEPKGAMLTHDNFVSNATFASSVMPWPQGGEVGVSFLPLSHVLERLVDYICFLKGVTIAYCGVLEIAEVFHRVRPNIFTAVPRVYEKIHARILEEVSHGPKVKRALFKTAVNVAIDDLHRGKRSLLGRVFDPLVYAKVRGAFGGRLRFSISGGAPLPTFVGEFFHAMGVMVLEGYGLTETSPVIAVNSIAHHRLGTVGRLIPGVEVRIADDGEILTRGRHVMKGYWAKPEATAAVIDQDGWFATGDIGEFDGAGFLRITDRKKDLLVTAGGKNVAPQPIESHLKSSPFIENAVLFGDRKPFVVALLVPNFEELERWATEQTLDISDRATLVRHPRVATLFAEIVEKANQRLARFEAIKKFRLVHQPLTMDGGELTPTLKVKRRVVEERYNHLLDEMYSEPAHEA